MNTRYPRIILAGTHSGVGKTTIALGITMLLAKKGMKVQNFKAGPDYIDPSYYRSCRNLDTWLLSRDVVLELFERQAKRADISIIEGVMGLYDGLKGTEEGSTAQLAKILNSPVILIVNASSMSRSAGAVVLGYREFDKKVNIKGIILNNVGSEKHYNSIKDNIDIPILGFLHRDKELNLPSRHLGLIPTHERRLKKRFYKRLLDLNIDIEKLIEIACDIKPLPQYKKTIFKKMDSVVIAVARDKAFNFYYEDNLDILRLLGAKIVEFSPLKDKRLPSGIDGVYIGGGFPEVFARELSRNVTMRDDLHSGLPIYAECGGLMYLMKELNGYPMVGIFNGKVKMGDRLQPFGYTEVETVLSNRGEKDRAHLFHWSYIDGEDKKHSFIKGNVLASYAHLHLGSNIDLARNFIRHCEKKM